MKLQIKFTLKDGESLKEINRSKTFSNLNEEATNDNLINFAKAYMGLTDIDEYQVIKISTENIEMGR